MNTLFSRMIASDREQTTSTVRFLFRPRLDSAIFGSFPPLVEFLLFFLPPALSVYRTASTGETFAAMRAGFPVDIQTVKSVNTAEPMKISG